MDANNMDVNNSLISAIREGKLERARELINTYGLSYSQAWSEGYVLLCDAVKYKNTAVAKLLLTSSAKVNSKNPKHINTPLHFACKNGDIEIVKMLLDKGANVNIENQFGRTPLHNAIQNKNMEVTEILLNYGADVNCMFSRTWKQGYTPLHLAVETGSKDVVTFLLSRGANVNDRSKDGITPLHIAAKKGYIHIAEDLLKHDAYIYSLTRNKGYMTLHFAVENGSKEVVALLLSRGAISDVKGKDGITPLDIAVKKGYIHIAEDLLQHGAYNYYLTRNEGYSELHLSLLLSSHGNVYRRMIREGGITAFDFAVKKGCIHIAEVVLKHGAHSFTFEEGYTPLHIASNLGNEEAVKLLLIEGADVNATTNDNLTPLHIATKTGHETVVKLLLKHGAKVDNQDKDGKTTLHLAVEKGVITIIEDVLRYCPDINNQSNRSSLKIAVLGCGEEYKMIVEALLEYGFTVDPENANNPELLHAAVKKRYLKIVEDLLKYGADVNAQYERRKTPIFYAIENADLKMTNLLLTNGASLKDSPDLLHIAVEKERIEIVEALLQHDVDINACDEYGGTALHFTAFGNFSYIKREIAELLLSKGASVDAQTRRGVTTLHAAIEKEHLELVKTLLKYNANVNSRGINDTTPFHVCVMRSNEEICTILLNNGANVNAKQKDGTTALHIAAEGSTEKFVKVLLEHGANVDSRDKHGRTALYLGASRGYLEIIETLLKFGANIDSRDEDGRTPLYVANNKDVVKVLLERGANVDSKMKNGCTLLHLGAKKGCQNIVEIILKFGANIDSTDDHGLTALHIAGRNGHEEVVVTLLEYGSDINMTCGNDDTPLNHAMAGIRKLYSWPVAKALNRHIVKMKTANLYVSEKNLQSMSSSGEISGFPDECEEEVARMKKEKINNLNISYYDILAKGTISLAICMSNENIVCVGI